MRPATLTRLLSISLLLLPQSARAGAVDDALEQVEEAIDAVRQEGGRCKRGALGPLEDAQAALESAGKRSRKKALAKAGRALASALDEAEDCPKKVVKQLRQARAALEDDEDDRAKDDDEEAQPRAAKRSSSVPYADSARDCQDLWFMHRFTARTSNEARALDLIGGLSEIVCRSGQDLGSHTWPNGQTAKYANGEWHYPNGQTAKYANGEWHYPNGQTAKYAGGEWHYPNGQVAGDWKALLAWACGRLGKAACDATHREFDSDIDDWRDYALVDLAYRAGRGR